MPIKSEHIIKRQGKDHVLYPGLLDAAHEQGLKRITTKLLQAPGPDNGHVAICFAEVETEKGTFSGIGDASPGNVSTNIAPHIIRMSETRAKARAFRDALNVGELLADDPSADDDHETAPQRQPGVATRGAARIDADSPRKSDAERAAYAERLVVDAVARNDAKFGPRPLAGRPAPFDDAPHPADTFDTKPDLAAMSRFAATPKQLETLAKFRVTVRDGLTRAEASDLISQAIAAKAPVQTEGPR